MTLPGHSSFSLTSGSHPHSRGPWELLGNDNGGRKNGGGCRFHLCQTPKMILEETMKVQRDCIVTILNKPFVLWLVAWEGGSRVLASARTEVESWLSHKSLHICEPQFSPLLNGVIPKHS